MTALRWYQRTNDGHIAEFPGRVRRMTPQLVTHADEGSVGSCRLSVDDPNADFAIRGHRKVYALHPDIDPDEDISAGVVYVGYTGDRDHVGDLAESPEIGRTIDMALYDLNTVLERRFLTDRDAARPAETDLQRIAWLLGEHVMDLIDDSSLVATTGGVMMDETDYKKQSAAAVLSDCRQQSGRDSFVVNLKQTPDADGDPCLFSLFYDFTEAEVLETDLRISNDPADANADTFQPANETKLHIDPAQVYSGCIVDYAGGYVYVKRPQTATDFALGGRDTTFSAPNVKNASTARARGLRYLSSLATEQHTVSTSIVVRGAQLNRLQAGFRVQFKNTHFVPEGYAEFVWMRALNRTVRELGDDQFEIAVELTRDIASPAFSSDSGGILYRGTLMGPSGQLFFDSSGDAPEAGLPADPTTGLIEMLSDPDEGGGADRPFYGIKINGTGTVDGELFATWAGVEVGIGTEYTITLALAVNGTVVASTISVVGIPVGAGGFLAFASGGLLLNFAGIDVVPDDVLTAVMACSPPMPMFTVPAGAGQGGERLVISGGTLV